MIPLLDIDAWFGSSRTLYAVIAVADIQRMPTAWVRHFHAMANEFARAFAHVEQVERYEVWPAEVKPYGELTDEELHRCGLTYDGDGTDGIYFDKYNDVFHPDEQIAVSPVGARPFAAVVLPRVLLQNMSAEWQHQMVDLLLQLAHTLQDCVSVARVVPQAYRRGEWVEVPEILPHFRTAARIEPVLEHP